MDAHRFFPRFWSVLALACAVGLLMHATPAQAQDASPDVLNKVTKLNQKAVAAYQKRDYETARNVLKDALDLCNSSGLDKHPIKARTHIHLGIVMIAGFKQRDSGIKHFKKALQIQPDIQLTKSLSTPALQDAFEEAMVGQGGGNAGGGADDSGGNAAQSDNDQGSNSGGNASADGDESPPARRKAPPKKKKKRRDDDEGAGDDDSDGSTASASSRSKRHGGDDDDDDDASGGANNAGKIFVGLTLGSGFGIASGTGEMSSLIPHTLASAGFAPAQLVHISPEVGYFISSNLLLSLQGRYQIVTGLNPGPATCGTSACTTKTSAIAVFARATYFLLDGDLHPFIGGSLGGGAVRHVSNFPADTSCGQNNQTCVDTLQAGPILVGPNAGLIYDIGKTASLILSINTQLGVPKFTFNLDANVGVGLKF